MAPGEEIERLRAELAEARAEALQNLTGFDALLAENAALKAVARAAADLADDEEWWLHADTDGGDLCIGCPDYFLGGHGPGICPALALTGALAAVHRLGIDLTPEPESEGAPF